MRMEQKSPLVKESLINEKKFYKNNLITIYVIANNPVSPECILVRWANFVCFSSSFVNLYLGNYLIYVSLHNFNPFDILPARPSFNSCLLKLSWDLGIPL